MKKGDARKSLKTGGSNIKDKATIKFGTSKFSFENGDVYEGEYKIHYGELVIVKEGKGIYTTSNFDVYDGEWKDDAFADSKIHIRYNNDAQFRGNVDSNGIMNGPGIYIFPDGSSIESNWLNDKPFTNIIYREPRGYKWILENMSEEMILFSHGNHFWNDMLSNMNTTRSTENL
ncbi:hypothetical protein WN55_06457 [Dufourea novaeangliae]|uniref:Uncharacterized protein n=1 Tax=Dufourea novaeangliae TaxID=178035 RepID=A0A154P0W3_DUFNO|nr:hypothetical protein WN55_06457 [Dufourea novaeangliae]